MKKSIKYIILPLLLIITAAAAAWGIALGISCRKSELPAIPEYVEIGASSQFAIGETIPCSVKFTLPLCGKIHDISVEGGKYAVLAGSPETVNLKRGLLSSKKELKFNLRAITPGTTSDGVVTFTIALPRKKGNFTVKIPQFTISEPTVTEIKTLQLANKEEILVKKDTSKIIAAVTSVIIVAAIMLTILYFLCFKKRETPLSEWERARGELQQLKSDVELERITPAKGIARLTDLVRQYLENRFGLPATRRTTSEFLEDISGNSQFLPDGSKPFLKNFLNASDRVKFALATPDRELLKDALNEAVKLVEITRPEDIKEKKDV